MFSIKGKNCTVLSHLINIIVSYCSIGSHPIKNIQATFGKLFVI